MARSAYWWCTRPKPAALIWFISMLIFYALFLAARRFTSPIAPADNKALYAARRSILYSKMARDLDEHGPAFLKQGETSQSLALSDIFNIKHGVVKPILKPENPPVRANVLYLSPYFSINISEVVKDVFSPHFTNIPATEQEIDREALAAKAVALSACPLKIVLDRVVLTSTGVLLGCWQVISGTDPITIRAALRAALPHAPKDQLYDTAILHTSFARILGHPTSLKGLSNTSEQLHFFHELVTRVDNRLRGFEAVVSELWFVEEYDILALALDGNIKVRPFQLGCRRDKSMP